MAHQFGFNRKCRPLNALLKHEPEAESARRRRRRRRRRRSSSSSIFLSCLDGRDMLVICAGSDESNRTLSAVIAVDKNAPIKPAASIRNTSEMQHPKPVK